MRLPKHNRLTKSGDFRRVYQSKYWGNTRLFSFNIEPLTGNDPVLESPKLGVTVSRKVAKSAVARNRIKRQIKEFYRLRQTELMPVVLVITAKPACLLASDAERLSALQELWQKIAKWQRWYQREQRKSERPTGSQPGDSS